MTHRFNFHCLPHTIPHHITAQHKHTHIHNIIAMVSMSACVGGGLSFTVCCARNKMKWYDSFSLWAWTANPKSSSSHHTKAVGSIRNGMAVAKVKGYYWLAVAYCADVYVCVSVCVWTPFHIVLDISVLFSFPCDNCHQNCLSKGAYSTTHSLNHFDGLSMYLLFVCSVMFDDKPIHYCNFTFFVRLNGITQ